MSYQKAETAWRTPCRSSPNPWASSPQVKFAEAFGVVGGCEHSISSCG